MVLQGQGFYYNPDFFVDGSRRLTRVEGYVSDIVADKTIDWLENREDKDRPFFLCSWHKAPHRTWLPAERHFHFLDKVEVPEPDNLFDDYGGNRNSNLKRQTMTVATELNMAYDLKVTPPVSRTEMEAFWEGVEPTESMDRTTRAEFARMDDWQRQVWDTYYEPRNQAVKAMGLAGKDLVRWKYQAYMKDYLRCIKAMDENIGRVLNYLDESGLAENTIVIYSSDQGFYNGEHGWYDKRWMYEESMRNPLIIRWPAKVAAGQRLEQLVQNIDYAPTLLDIAGVEVPEAVQGTSFKPVLLGEPVDWRKSLLYTYYERGIHDVAMHYGVRDERYKLIHFPETGEWELFDLETDPAEMHNQYGNPFFSGQVKRLKAELENLMNTFQVDDPLQHVLKEQQS